MSDQRQKLIDCKNKLESEIPQEELKLKKYLESRWKKKKIPSDYVDVYQLEKKLLRNKKLLASIEIALTFNIGDRVEKIRNSDFIYTGIGEKKRSQGTVAYIVLYNKVAEIWVKWDHLAVAPLPESPNNLLKVLANAEVCNPV